jgi:hypothetical protein
VTSSRRKYKEQRRKKKEERRGKKKEEEQGARRKKVKIPGITDRFDNCFPSNTVAFQMDEMRILVTSSQ